MLDAALSRVLTQQDLLKVCERYFVKSSINFKGFKLIKSEVKNVSEAPQGFLATHNYLHLWVEVQDVNGGNSVQILKLFLKTVPNNTTQKEYVEGFAVFKKESKVFEKVVPLMRKWCIAGHPEFSPKCYFASPEVLIFEDLVSQGFRLGTRSDSTLDYAHLACVLRALACQHAASFVYEEKSGKSLLDVCGDYLAENSYPDSPGSIRYIVFQTASGVLCEFVKLIPKYGSSPGIAEILAKFRKALSQIFVFVKPSTKYRNAFLHGDMWANNVMFRYTSRESVLKPIECRLFDYQLARYAPPIFDVMAILTIPTRKEFREKHLDKLLREYYASLREFLAENGVDISKIISEREFWESVEEFKLAGLIESCLFSHLTLLPPDITTGMIGDPDKFDEFLNSQRAKVCLEAFNRDEVYRERLSEMISEVIDYHT